MIDKKEAEQIFTDEFGENIVDILGYNPLPISCLINLDKQNYSINKTEKLVQTIENTKGVLSVEYEGKLLSNLERTYSFVLGFLKIMVGVVLIISIIIITNTVKLTMNARSELIRTLKLIGATNLFVKTPFIFEGILQSILGAFAAYGLLIWGVIELNHILVDWIPFQLTIGTIVLFLIMTVSVVIGFVGSINAVSKFLK
jgi:cell division transport system permease protein